MIRVFLKRLIDDESGPTTAEYAVMLALILAVIITAINAVGGSTGQKWNNDSSQIINAIQGNSGSGGSPSNQAVSVQPV